MIKSKATKPVILAILFFLPVVFLLFLYPSQHNYNTLDIVKGDIKELTAFSSTEEETITLQDHLTVLGFLGNQPNTRTLTSLNLKELVYDKFKGFKKFQIVILAPNGTEEAVKALKTELNQYEVLKYWKFVFGTPEDIQTVFKSLRSDMYLDDNLASDAVFIIDKERNQRGRLDDREDYQIEKNQPVFGLFEYDCIEVAELKNKMSEDLRILFTEYRQKRKGNFNSTSRRADDIKGNEQK